MTLTDPVRHNLIQIEAKLTKRVCGEKVYFKVSDVDDLSDVWYGKIEDKRNIDPNDFDGVDDDSDGIIDNPGGEGNDNIGNPKCGTIEGANGWEDGYPYAITNNDGIAKVDFEVTWQPGNNYVAKASLYPED